MQRHLPALSLSAFGLVFTVLAQALPAQDSLQGQVSRLLVRADAGRLDAVWEVSHQILELDFAGQEDAVARTIADAAKTLGPSGRLAAARVLADLSDSGAWGVDILEILKPVCESDDETARAAAIGMLGTSGAFSSRVLPEVQRLLLEHSTSELVAPAVRVAAAKSLWSVGTDEQRSEARVTLKKFLSSEDRRLRIQGALALAEINADSSSAGDGWEVLLEIQDEPTAEGRLARSYVLREAERRSFEHLLRRSLERRGERSQLEEYATLEEIMRHVETQHVRGDKADRKVMLESAAKGMLRELDRHSSYFTSDEYQRFFFDLNREYGGIGAFVNFDRDDVFSIVRPIYSGPAYRAGLRSGDKILEVDGWETTGQTSEEIIARLKGKPDTKVSIKIYRPGMEEPEDVPIVREQIHVPSVNTEVLPGNIGYVELLTFGATTADELREALLAFQRDGVDGLILDVRSNTGGYLQAARAVVELFVAGERRVVYTKSRAGIDEDLSTRDNAVVPDVPLVVLVNEYSASASEIVAGALQDYERAVVVGKRSYGKGSVQSLIPLTTERGEPYEDQNDNGMRDDWEGYEDRNSNGKYDVGPRIKLTVARYYLPSGRTPNKEIDEEGKVLDPDWGIVPDHEVEMREYAPEEAWKVEPLRKLLKAGAFRKYVKEHFAANKELFLRLATGDGGDHTLYPDFEQFYAGLETPLSRDDVRRWVRVAAREEVADVRGKAFAGVGAMGDPQEDAQLQEAARVLLLQQGRDIREVEGYKGVLKIAMDEKKDEKTAVTGKEVGR